MIKVKSFRNYYFKKIILFLAVVFAVSMLTACKDDGVLEQAPSKAVDIEDPVEDVTPFDDTIPVINEDELDIIEVPEGTPYFEQYDFTFAKDLDYEIPFMTTLIDEEGYEQERDDVTVAPNGNAKYHIDSVICKPSKTEGYSDITINYTITCDVDFTMTSEYPLEEFGDASPYIEMGYFTLADYRTGKNVLMVDEQILSGDYMNEINMRYEGVVYQIDSYMNQKFSNYEEGEITYLSDDVDFSTDEYQFEVTIKTQYPDDFDCVLCLAKWGVTDYLQSENEQYEANMSYVLGSVTQDIVYEPDDFYCILLDDLLEIDFNSEEK